MNNVRKLRVEAFIRRSVEGLLVTMDDRELRLLTVTHVQLSSDSRLAKVFVSTLSTDEARKTVLMAALSRAAGKFQARLAADVSMRFTPLLSFHYDGGFVKGTRVAELLAKLEKEQPVDGDA